MKLPVIILCAIVLSSSAPTPRKSFHEHLEDFAGLIIAEKGQELEVLIKQYAENKEFCMALTYLRTSDFKDMLYKVESMQEFKTVTNFLEQSNINILYLIDVAKEIIDQNEKTRKFQHKIDGSQLNSFVRDYVNLLPKEKLANLLEEKKQQDEMFKSAVEHLHSTTWSKLYNTLWESDMFQKEVRELAENGINLQVILQHLGAGFGRSLLPKISNNAKTLITLHENGDTVANK